jgi:hypothetical protein
MEKCIDGESVGGCDMCWIESIKKVTMERQRGTEDGIVEVG